MKRISALTRSQRASSLSFYHMRIQEASSLQPTRGPSLDPDHVGTMSLDFQPLELREINFFYKTPSLRHFVIATLTD